MSIVRTATPPLTSRPPLLWGNQGAQATSAIALYTSWRNVTQRKLIKPLPARLCRHRTGVIRVLLVPLKMAFYCATKRAYTVRHTMRLSEPDQNQRIVSNSPKVKKQGQKNSDEIEFWRAYFFTSSYSFLYVRVEFGHHMGTIKTLYNPAAER